MISVTFNFSNKDVRSRLYDNFSELKTYFKDLDIMSKSLDKQGLSHGIPLTYLVINMIGHKELNNEKN